MSYTGTQAISGKGTLLQINTGTASIPTWTTVVENVDINPTGYENKTGDASNLQSTAAERITEFTDGGVWEIAGNYVSTDTGQAAMQAAFVSGALKSFKVILPKLTGQTTTGDSFAFSGIVRKWSPGQIGTKKIPVAGTIETSNGVIFTEGA